MNSEARLIGLSAISRPPRVPAARLEKSQAELAGLAGPLLTALEKSGISMVVTDPRLPDNPIVFCSLAFEQLTLFGRAQALGHNCRFLQTPETDVRGLDALRKALAAGEEVELVLLNARRDGRHFWNKLTMSALRSPGGEVAFFFATLADVTASHEANAAHVAVRPDSGQGEVIDERLRPELPMAATVGAWQWDVEASTLTVDPGFANLYGLSPSRAAEPLPSSMFFDAIHPKDVMRIRMAVRGMLSGATVFSKDFRLIGRGGITRWVHGEGRVQLDDKDQPKIFAGRLMDITDQKRIEERLRIAQTAGGIGTFENMEGFSTVLVSPQFCTLLGLHQTHVLPVATVDALILEAKDPFFGNSKDLTVDSVAYAEFQIRRPDDGRLRWIARRSELIRESDSATTRQIGVIFDITIAKQRESQLRALNEHLEAMVAERTRDRDRVWKNSRDLLVIMSADGTIRAVNPAWTAILGFDAEETVGRNFHEFIRPRKNAAAEAQKPPGPIEHSFETRFVHRDGGRRWISWLTTPEGDLIYAYGRHITDVKTQEAALTLERARLKAIFDTTSQLIGFTEPDGTVRVMNRATLDAIGLPLTAVSGRKLWELPWFTGTPGMPERIRDGVEIAATGQTVSMEIALTLPGGEARSYQFALRPVRNQAGRIVQIVPEAFDTTVLRRTEELLRQSQKMEAIGQLTGGIAHDFNNMLTGITGSLDLIRRRIEAGRTTDLTRFMDAASTSAQRAAALTHRLLAFARRQSLDTKPIDLSLLILGMKDLLHRALGEQVFLNTDGVQGNYFALSDENQLENALLNLAINARDAMPNGGRLSIATRPLSIDADTPLAHDGLKVGEYVEISVTDTGEGMAPDVLSKVFDPFFTTKPVGQGTGLGLSMVYGFVKQSGGHIDIVSQIGQGTTVKLLLPRAVPEDTQEAASPEQMAPLGHGETVLVIEDDPTVRLLIVEVLVELGYRYLEAIDSQTAIPIFHSNERLDLVVSDVGLPGLNGRQLAEIARSVRPGLKVLFVTGYAQSAIARSSFLGEGMAMISKPFVLKDLGLQIRKMLENGSRGDH